LTRVIRDFGVFCGRVGDFDKGHPRFRAFSRTGGRPRQHARHKKPEDIAFAAMSSGTITLLLTTKLTVTQFIAKGVPKSYFKTGTDPLKSHISEDQPADCATEKQTEC